MHYAILYISQPSLRECDVKFLISRALFMEYVNTRQQLNFLFLFLNLDTVLSDWTPENFAIIWQIEWTELEPWSLKQCEFTFWVTFSVCWDPEFLLPWQRDVMTSPLYWLITFSAIECQLVPTGTRTIRHINKGYVCMYVHCWRSAFKCDPRSWHHRVGN